MREIKFRAWDKDLHKIWGPFRLRDICRQDAFSINHLVFMQFTGLHDRNGKEIYEGDILKITTPHGEWVSEVFWEDELTGFYINEEPEYDEWHPLGTWMTQCYKIIGNIYENKDLL